mgnify:CR=1 FL=1
MEVEVDGEEKKFQLRIQKRVVPQQRAAEDELVLAEPLPAGRAGLRSTIVRPGRLTDEAGTGRVQIAESTGRGEIPRADVAAVLLAVLDDPGTAGRTFELIGGDTPISDAL